MGARYLTKMVTYLEQILVDYKSGSAFLLHLSGKSSLTEILSDEDYGKTINLMSWGVVNTIIKLSELLKFNFNKIGFDF